MRKTFILLFVLTGLQAHLQEIRKPGKPGSRRILLSNGWSLSPAGRSLPLGDLPLNIALSSSKKLMAVTNNGQSTQSLQLIDPINEKLLDEITIPKSWYGLKFTDNGRHLYASGGNDNWILKYSTTHNKLKLVDSIKLGNKWPARISPAGIDIDESRNLLYVMTKENDKLYIINLKSHRVTDSLYLGGEGYACVLSPGKNELYISCWGCDKLIVFDTWKKRISREYQVGDNPNEICISKNGTWLFVANANDNSVTVINLKQVQVVEKLDAALFPNSPAGSTTNGLALSEDEKTLYIANADNNCLAVFDVSSPGQSRSKGFIPVGWYPTNVKVTGRKIFVTNGKGFSSMANPHGPNPLNKGRQVWYQQGDTASHQEQYIGGLFKGTLSIIDQPTEKQLAEYSKQVYDNTPYSKNKELTADIEQGSPVPSKVGDKSPVKYIFYIVKENRTYDQVLGDMKEGNGDPSLTLFGEDVTPNEHALARQFVLLDNFYVDGEVSADGHSWSLGAYATDFLEKIWPTSYGGRGGGGYGEGNRETANNKLYIWDDCKRHNVSYRTYGEFADNYKPNIPVLRDHLCPYFTGWNLDVRDTIRFHQWKRDFDSLLAINKLPQLNTIRFPNDHTEGLRKGKPTPFSHVADNDLAVGKFVEYLSHSPVWKESVVFILEDDAQNGSDHVDAHRSTAYIAGGFIKRGFVDHTMYSTSSMIRTMELILGLPPMTQYDAAATPMWRSFNKVADATPFTARPIKVDLNNRNIAVNKWQKRSEKFDFTKEDAVPDAQFNEVLWHAVKGDQPLPVPRRAAFLKPAQDKDDN